MPVQVRPGHHLCLYLLHILAFYIYLKHEKIVVIFGTRPEAIKLAPLIKEIQKSKKMTLKICVTAQHRDMLDQILKNFKIKPDYDLNLMKKSKILKI